MAIEKELVEFEPSVIMHSGQCFRMTEEEPGCFLALAGSHFLKIVQDGRMFSFSCTEREFKDYWENYFDLSTDYQSIRKTVDPDDVYLSSAVRAASGLRILRQELFETIITFIISQRNNIPRIRKCVENICTHFGREMKAFGHSYYAFPSPEALAGASSDELGACNLGYRAGYIRETSKMILGGAADPATLADLSDADAKAELMKLLGVGTKVADCVLLFSLHRTAAFPIDTHIRQVLDTHYQNGFPFERYEGFAGIMQQYIFYGEVNADKQSPSEVRKVISVGKGDA